MNKLHKDDVHELNTMIIRALPDPGWNIMSGWYFGMDFPEPYVPDSKQMPHEMFSRHIRAGRLDKTTRSLWTGLVDQYGFFLFFNDLIELNNRIVAIETYHDLCMIDGPFTIKGDIFND